MESTYARGGIQDRISPGAESRPRGQMQPALWQQLVTAETPERYCQSWLALQCGLISGVTTGVVMLQRSADTALAPVAFWPEVPQDQRHLAEAAERALLEGRGVVLRRESSGLDEGPPQVRYHLAYPVRVAGRLQSIIALDLAPRSAPQVHVVMRQLQWGSAWLALFFQRQQQTLQSASQGRTQTALALLATLLECPRVQAAATAFVTALADRLACDRVSLGFVHRGQVRVRAISHSAHFGKRTNLTRALEAAMDEAWRSGDDRPLPTHARNALSDYACPRRTRPATRDGHSVFYPLTSRRRSPRCPHPGALVRPSLHPCRDRPL